MCTYTFAIYYYTLTLHVHSWQVFSHNKTLFVFLVIYRTKLHTEEQMCVKCTFSMVYNSITVCRIRTQSKIGLESKKLQNRKKRKIRFTCTDAPYYFLNTDTHCCLTLSQHIQGYKTKASALCSHEDLTKKQQVAASTGRKAAEKRGRSMWLVPVPKTPLAAIESREPWRWGKEAWRKGAVGEYRRAEGEGIRRWRGCRPGWCGDKNWFIAALMRSGVPGEGGRPLEPSLLQHKMNREPSSLPLKFLQRSRQRLCFPLESGSPGGQSLLTVFSCCVLLVTNTSVGRGCCLGSFNSQCKC